MRRNLLVIFGPFPEAGRPTSERQWHFFASLLFAQLQLLVHTQSLGPLSFALVLGSIERKLRTNCVWE